MKRLWLFGVAGLTALFGLLIGGARAMPAGQIDPAIFEALFDETCQLPCTMGITPGSSDIATALTTLKAHEWVAWVQADWNTDLRAHELTLRWTWSGAQPAFIDQNLPGTLFARTESDNRPYPVVWLTLPTTLRLYDLQVALGEVAGSRAYYDGESHQINYLLNFPAADSPASITLRAQIPCPAHLMNVWHSRATLLLSEIRQLGSYVPPDALAQLCP